MEGEGLPAKQTSVIFEEQNAYQKAVTRGNMFLSPEAHEVTIGDESDPEDDTKQDENFIQRAGVQSGLESLDHFLESNEKLAVRDGGVDWTYNVRWHIKIWPDSYNDAKHTKPDGKLKPRRGPPQAKASEFLKGLERVDGSYIYKGALNEWGGLTYLALSSITVLEEGRVTSSVKHLWKHGDNKPLPDPSTITTKARATMFAPAWSKVGWTPSSQGFLFWYSTMHGEPRVIAGESAIDTLRADDAVTATATVTNVHLYSHRYPVEKPTMKDSITWHSFLMVEWSHGQFTTVVELAYVNGVGGYSGKANWVEDKLAEETVLKKTLPDAMVLPWETDRSEIRMYDLAAKNKQEFDEYVNKYSDKSGIPLLSQRFVEPTVNHSAPLKMQKCTPADLVTFALNYIQRLPSYSEVNHNCQTFAADYFMFLTGSRNVEPVTNAVSLAYRQHFFAFLYRPTENDNAARPVDVAGLSRPEKKADA